MVVFPVHPGASLQRTAVAAAVLPKPILVMNANSNSNSNSNHYNNHVNTNTSNPIDIPHASRSIMTNNHLNQNPQTHQYAASVQHHYVNHGERHDYFVNATTAGSLPANILAAATAAQDATVPCVDECQPYIEGDTGTVSTHLTPQTHHHSHQPHASPSHTHHLHIHTANATSKKSKKPHLVFVYGTLKRTFPNANFLEEAEFVGEYKTLDQYPLVIGGEWNSPYLLNVQGKGHYVTGEVYYVNDETLDALDRLENVGVNYTRKVLQVHHIDEPFSVIQAYAYLKCNYTSDLLSKEPVANYQDRRYVPRSQRAKVTAARAAAAEAAAAAAMSMEMDSRATSEVSI